MARVRRRLNAFAAAATAGMALPASAALSIAFPSGLPPLLAPDQPRQAIVTIMDGSQTLQVGTAAMHFRTEAGSFTTLPLQHIGGSDWAAMLPGFPCGRQLELYFSAEGNLGTVVHLPANAPVEVFAAEVATLTSVMLLETSFDAAWPAGWWATGFWHVSSACAPPGQPCAPGPYAYFGRSAVCNYGGVTSPSGRLHAPLVQLPQVLPPPYGSITLSFCYALETEQHPSLDKAELFVNGQSRPQWRLPDASSWATAQFDLTEFAGEEISLSWRFDAVTSSNNNFRGWHLDQVRLEAQITGCDTCYADCDGSGVLNIDDFICFISEYASAFTLHGCLIMGTPCYANCDDSTTDPILNVEDFICFINEFAQGCP
jgi:hypothetical protein